MHEIVRTATVQHTFVILAIVGPIAGVCFGAAAGIRARRVRRTALTGLAIGCLGTANYLLWILYNGVVNHFGLDTVAAAAVSLAMFALVGGVAGAVAGKRLRSKAPH
ncbi:MAG: hypothetical protein KGJ62_13845 [Armatimonadetes bacterium]|nr:hypothetical protein [Armatimonadota bacterium]MDE2206367.1 hypothetical protein [Armatimonadota bacterium]